MLSLSTATRIFVALDPVDMRQSFNGLYARVQTVLQEEPTSGHWFVFTNKPRNRLKILFGTVPVCSCAPSAWRKALLAGPPARAKACACGPKS
jgi:transposase